MYSSEALLAEQAKVLEQIVRGAPLETVLAALCRLVEAHPDDGPVRAAISLLDQDGRRLRTGAAPSLPDDYIRALDGLMIARDVGTCSAAAARSEVVVTPDLAADPGWAQLRQLPLALGLVAAWSMPILSSSGRVLGTFGSYFTEKREPQPRERALVEVMARIAALAIERERADRTLRDQARNLRDSEERYRTMVEATPECVKLVASDGTLLQMNAAGLRALEIEDEVSAIGSNIYDMIAPEHRERFRQFNEQVCRGQAGVIEFDVIGRAGTRRSMETTAVPLAARGSGFRQLAITRDVSARVAAAHALAESRARVDYAVRLSGVGFWYCDLPFDELQWDAQVKSHFFLAPDARVTIETFYEQIHADDRENTRIAIDTSIREGRSYDVTYRTCDPSTGAIKWIRALGGTTYADDGTPIRFDGVTVDVTENARLYEQLREQDRRKDEFLATLAHELRNPLAPIRTGIQVLERGAPQSEQVTGLLAMMDRQLGHLVHMVDDLLDISRITLGKVSLKRQRIDIRAALDSALETTRTLVEARGHELAVRLASDPLPVDVDPTRLSQVFSNLVNNAAKYTPVGGRILIVAEPQDDTLYVRVSDTGVGIPEDMLSRVFDMFTQVGRSLDRSQGGLGIGLTLVRRLVEMHGGSVNAESPGIGQGSTFTVRLPLAMREVRPADSTATEGVPAGARQRLRILVVDDNVDAAETLAMLLELGGNMTRLAHDGRAALELVREFRPELVFLDIGLPEMTGYEVAERVRADPTITQPVLVALTGWGSEEDRKQAYVAGFDSHLVKPIDSAKLEVVLASTRT